MRPVPVLDDIYATGEVEDADGLRRRAFPTAVARDVGEGLHRYAALAEGTLEVGLAYGVSALWICAAHAERGHGLHIAVDPLQESYFRGTGRLAVERAGMGTHLRVVEEPSHVGFPQLVSEGTRVGLAFVDGMHTFDHALVDAFFCDQMLEPGGHLVLDDVWLPSLRRVLSFWSRNRDYEVVEKLGRYRGRRRTAVLRKRGEDTRRWDHFVRF